MNHQTQPTEMDSIDISMIQANDPENTIKLGDEATNRVPALTTLLYKVCDNDANKFHEATRLIRIFMEQAITDHGGKITNG